MSPFQTFTHTHTHTHSQREKITTTPEWGWSLRRRAANAFWRPPGHTASPCMETMSAFNSNSRHEKKKKKLESDAAPPRSVSLQLSPSVCQSTRSVGCFNIAQISLLCRVIFIIQEWRSVHSQPCNWKIVQICCEWGLVARASDFRPVSGNKIGYYIGKLHKSKNW